MSVVDALTQLPSLQACISSWDALRARPNSPILSIAVLDIDTFTYVNQDFGWKVADQVLHDMAGIIRDEVGDHAVSAFRVAGDEFVLMAVEERLDRFLAILRMIQNAVYNKKFPYRRNPYGSRDRITVSIAATSVPASAAPDLRTQWDQLLNTIYDEKAKGRRFQVFCIKSCPPPLLL